jgi:isoleucyl-tRNA synthetase
MSQLLLSQTDLRNDKMSTKFTEYKGLDLPTVASEVLDFWKKNNVFEQSVTSREGNLTLCVF